MTYLLVLQWSTSSTYDYDALMDRENLLHEELDDDIGSIDGHDLGSGEMNIFIVTETPNEAFAAARECLHENENWNGVRAAYRLVDGDSYTILWPDGLRAFTVS